MTPGGDGGAGKILSAEHIAKLRIAHSGERNNMAGRFGSDHPAFGHRKTEEQKQRISLAHKGRLKSEEQRQALSRAKKATSRFSEADYKEMLRLYGSGLSVQAVGQAMNCTGSVVYKIIQREFPEHKIRPRGGPIQHSAEALAKKSAGSFKGENAGPSKVLDADRAEICRRRAVGEAYSSIAADYPLGLTGIRAVVKDWGPLNGFPFQSMTAKRGTKLTDDQKAVACKRCAAGESYLALAREFAVGETTMFEIIRRWGPENGFPYASRVDSPVQ